MNETTIEEINSCIGKTVELTGVLEVNTHANISSKKIETSKIYINNLEDDYSIGIRESCSGKTIKFYGDLQFKDEILYVDNVGQISSLDDDYTDACIIEGVFP